MHDVRAFTMASEGYFLGAVALLNSLRITGHPFALTVLDTGMAAWQRNLLEPHCELRDARPDVIPYIQKMDAPLAAGADLVLMLDSDIIVTGSLLPMIEDAAAGKVCAFDDEVADRRWFAEWQELFGLRAPLRKEPYVNAGAIAVSTSRMPTFLPRWKELCELVADRPTMWNAPLGALDPLWLADQEPLNALLQSEVHPDAVVRYPEPRMVLTPVNLAQTRVDDVARLRCSRGGEPVTLLHSVGRLKPWHRRANREYRRTAYTTLLRRLLIGDDLELEVPRERLPGWLRPGAAAAATAWALHGYDAGARATRPLRQRVGLSGTQPVPVPGG